MPEVTVVNSEGAEVGKVVLSAEIFEIQPNTSLMHRAVVTHLANLRAGSADTLTRSEVRGGGAKPYRQKGTGRARQGSIRSPHYPGGGIVFGPHPRDYDQQMPKKMRRLAIKSALAAKLADEAITIIDELKLDTISTKVMVEKLNKIGANGKVLLIVGASDETIKKSARNIPWLTLRVSPSVSTYDLLHADKIMFTQDALAKIEEAHGK